MEIPISEARRTLPELVKRVRGSDSRVLITVHGEVAAELRGVTPEPPPGAAAAKLLEVMARLPEAGEASDTTSEEVTKHLYGEDPE
jgi:antitoxin (DNA-binding transcriptional repressor) of toxin-antitoxin stability system